MSDNPDDAAPEQVYEVIRAVRPLFRNLLRSVEEALEGSGVTVAMRGVLEQLSEKGPLTVPQLAQLLLIQRQFTQLVVNGLVAGGLAETAVNRAHRRSRLVRLTPSGESAFRAIKDREMAEITAAASGLSAQDVEACLRVLDRLTVHFTAGPEPDPIQESLEGKSQ